MEEYNSLNNKKKYKILFVCLGNICRSPMAEEVFRTLAARAGCADEFSVDSAGLIDFHEGELPDMRMREHASRRGYCLTHHSRPVRPDDFRKFDLIVGMDEQNIKGLQRMAGSADGTAKIVRMADYLTRSSAPYVPDPYYGSDKDFELVIDLLEEASTELLGRL